MSKNAPTKKSKPIPAKAKSQGNPRALPAPAVKPVPKAPKTPSPLDWPEGPDAITTLERRIEVLRRAVEALRG